MQYYILKGLGYSATEKYCHVAKKVEGANDKKLVLQYGGSLKGFYPDDPYEVKMYLDEDKPKHIVKGDFVSTPYNYVMVSNKAVEEIKQHNIASTEFWPFTLINHKGREHSKDYYFVVPCAYDALHMELSDIKRDKNNVAIRIRKIVLDNKKLENAPEIFRINDTRRMAFSESLATILSEKYTNYAFEKAEQA